MNIKALPMKGTSHTDTTSKSLALAITTLLAFSSLPLQAAEALTQTPQIENATTVRSHVVEYQAVSRPVVATGQLVNKGTQTLSFKVTGTIEKITADEGQKVKQGQILAILDKEQTQARFNQAKSLHEQSLRDLKRQESLFKKKVVPLDNLQDARTALSVAKSNLDIAAYNLKHTQLIAPQDGVVLSRLIETNELVAPHQQAFVISDASQGWVIRTAVSDKDIVRINLGDEVNLRFDAYPGQAFQGAVSEIAAAASPKTLLFEVEITIAPTKNRLLAGFVGHMLIQPSEKENIAWLPVEAVVAADNDTVKLFKVEKDSRVVLQEAQVAWLESGRVAIKEGLTSGAEIVTLGATFLQEGERVAPIH